MRGARETDGALSKKRRLYGEKENEQKIYI